MISVLFFDLIKKHVDLQYSCLWFITKVVEKHENYITFWIGIIHKCNGADADLNQIKLEQRRAGEMSYINGTSLAFINLNWCINHWKVRKNWNTINTLLSEKELYINKSILLFSSFSLLVFVFFLSASFLIWLANTMWVKCLLFHNK